MLYPVYSVGKVTLSEVPGKTSLVIEFGNCTQHCKGCHSKWLWDEDVEVDWIPLSDILKSVSFHMTDDISCILLMGGTTNGIPLEDLKTLVESLYREWSIPIAVYSGSPEAFLPLDYMLSWEGLDYLKTGDYRRELGGIECSKSNQKFYQKELKYSLINWRDVKVSHIWIDITHKFRKEKNA